MATLLRDTAGNGYPTDYLLARVRARRAALDAAGRTLRALARADAASDEAIWDAMLHEHAWLRSQMEPWLRRHLDDLFLLFELKTIVLALRCRAAQRTADVRRLLADSQLGDALRRALIEEPDVPAAVAAVAEAWADATGEPSSLPQAYAAGALHGFEHRLVRDHVERFARSRLHPAMRSFVDGFVDLRNLVTLYKHLRWAGGEAGDFIRGGRLDPATLRAASAAHDAALLDTLARQVLGRSAPVVTIEESALETVLLQHLSAEVRAIARADEDVGVILDYAWRLYVHARNRAVLLHAGEFAGGRIERELVA